jgi:acyl-CoA synthetase (AMP-forming)/AMP-acid ligase II
VGRVHNAIQRGGRYEFPVRAEMILKKLPFVKLAAYLGIPDPQLGEKAVCVVTGDDVGNSHSQWKSEIERIMKKNGVPVDQVVITQSIPMDPRHHSKVEYEVLKKELTAAQLV